MVSSVEDEAGMVSWKYIYTGTSSGSSAHSKYSAFMWSM